MGEEIQRQDKRPNQHVWDRKRKGWNELLALWQADLAPPPAGSPAPPRVLTLPHREQMSTLAKAILAWMDAEGARRFGPSRPEAAQCKALEQAVRDCCKNVLVLLNPAPP